jgi:hypothetical protein
MAISRGEFQSAQTCDQWQAGWTRNHERFAVQERAYQPDPSRGYFAIRQES